MGTLTLHRAHGPSVLDDNSITVLVSECGHLCAPGPPLLSRLATVCYVLAHRTRVPHLLTCAHCTNIAHNLSAIFLISSLAENRHSANLLLKDDGDLLHLLQIDVY